MYEVTDITSSGYASFLTKDAYPGDEGGQCYPAADVLEVWATPPVPLHPPVWGSIECSQQAEKDCYGQCILAMGQGNEPTPLEGKVGSNNDEDITQMPWRICYKKS